MTTTTSGRAVDDVATAAFAEHYGRPELGPVAVVIAAYNEAGGIGAVIDAVPKESRGEAVSALVVDDGSSDATGSVAIEHGAFACVAPVNRGQGAALRLGYQIAASHGARYIVTLDADGQYDPGQMDRLLEPLRADQADFVSGSRRLGHSENADPVRQAGVVFFAWLISLLTRTRITDPSNGFRAMRADIPGKLVLEQDQYQAAELLIGVIRRGYRVTERPVTMVGRRSGTTKKGNNLIYALRFARVVLGTWLRER